MCERLKYTLEEIGKCKPKVVSITFGVRELDPKRTGTYQNLKQYPKKEISLSKIQTVSTIRSMTRSSQLSTFTSENKLFNMP